MPATRSADIHVWFHAGPRAPPAAAPQPGDPSRNAGDKRRSPAQETAPPAPKRAARRPSGAAKPSRAGQTSVAPARSGDISSAATSSSGASSDGSRSPVGSVPTGSAQTSGGNSPCSSHSVQTRGDPADSAVASSQTRETAQLQGDPRDQGGASSADDDADSDDSDADSDASSGAHYLYTRRRSQTNGQCSSSWKVSRMLSMDVSGHHGH